MPATLRIHPSIGIARLGNSPSSFYIAPESAGALPIECDENGIPSVPPATVSSFKDDEGRIRRQAARFRIYVYDEDDPDGRELEVGAEVTIRDARSGQLRTIRVDDVSWNVYLANKKASWYEFQQTNGEHGYDPSHPLRNADIVNAEERQRLIIDPGSRTVRYGDPKQRRASFAASGDPTQTYPPPSIVPNAIQTLGDLLCTQVDKHSRLLVLGGHGNSGSMKSSFGNPKIESYANNDGWFDDISDGQVTASISCTLLKINGVAVLPGTGQPPVPVDDPAWVIVGYPRYAPQVVDIITMDELIYDVSVRNFAYAPYIYGIPPFDGAQHPPRFDDDMAAWRASAVWNREYRPYFWTDIWPILQRPFRYQFLMDKDPTVGGDPHEIGPGGAFDPAQLSVAPYEGEDPVVRANRATMRQLLYEALRKQGRENDLYAPPTTHLIDKPILFAMPLLCGDNPIDNVAPSKFLRLTDTMLFLLRQWAEGKFIDEKSESIEPAIAGGEGAALDRGVLGSVLGGSFCPGGEASWIMRNPAIYSAPYRIRHAAVQAGALSQPAVVQAGDGLPASLARGLEPGDITKYSGVPWQADFNECTTQDIDVTYRDWNELWPASTGDPVQTTQHLTYWWPAHRPDWVATSSGMKPWSPTAVTNAGDLAMVTLWATRGFVLTDPSDPSGQSFILTETD
jgi:hypothetical protein